MDLLSLHLNTVSFIDLHRIQQKLENFGFSIVNWRISENPQRLVISNDKLYWFEWEERVQPRCTYREFQDSREFIEEASRLVERKIKREYTMQEIADKLGILVSELRIKGE
nr:MAG TPA: Putative transcriptional regulator GENOMICS, TETR, TRANSCRIPTIONAL REGULATOR.65A [Crassvirales sp.]